MNEPSHPLSAREKEVVILIASGLSCKELNVTLICDNSRTQTLLHPVVKSALRSRATTA